MISLLDCIAMCGLTREEVQVLAEHERLPEIIAAAMAQCMLKQEQGARRIRDIIIADVRRAQGVGDRHQVQKLLHVLHHFLKEHPDARPQPPDGRA